jgi:uncharacterized repeat protein (TIGR03803 family)
LGPAGSLIQDREGNLYGTTNEGGTPERGGCRHGCGAVFKLDATGKNKVLYAFTGGGDGGHPEANLIRDAEGNLYGTTADGGDLACDANGYYPGCGVVFRVNKDGNQTVLHAFSGSRDGAYPNGGLIRDKAENLYGVTSQGGALGSGMIFKLNRTGKETALYAFSGATDGGGPNGPLLRDAAGNLYGTTGSGGDPSCNCGVAFKLDTSGHETILYTFTTLDVGHPVGGLIRDPSGNYYSATSANWNCECGTVFELNTSGQLSVLFSFFGQQDGSNPTGNLVIDGAGDLFGTATYDGDRCPEDNYPCGIAFEITP